MEDIPHVSSDHPSICFKDFPTLTELHTKLSLDRSAILQQRVDKIKHRMEDFLIKMLPTIKESYFKYLLEVEPDQWSYNISVYLDESEVNVITQLLNAKEFECKYDYSEETLTLSPSSL